MEDVGLPVTFESDDSEDENLGGTPSPSRSLLGSKSDPLAPQTVTPPKGPQTQGDVTSVVTDTAVTLQDRSPVQGSTHPSSSTPVKQEGTAAQSFEVSAEVYAVMGSERGAVDVSEGQIQAPSCMSLGTQVGSDLSYSEGLSLAPPQSTDDTAGPCLEIDPSGPVGEIASQMRAQLQLARSPISGGAGLAPLSYDDLVVFEQWVHKVRLENLPQLQPKQVTCLGVRELVQALKGTQIRLVPMSDRESNTSIMNLSHDSSFHQGFLSSDPLGLETGGPSDLEDGQIVDHSHTSEPMDQSDNLGHGVQSTGGTVSDASVAPGGGSDLPSEEMDTTAQPSETESHSSLPTTSQGARSHRSGPFDYGWGGGEEDEMSRRHRLYLKVLPYMVPHVAMVQNGWYQGEDCMNPTEVAPSVCRPGKPNMDGSIGGHKAHPLPPR